MHDPMTVAFEIRKIPWRGDFLDNKNNKFNAPVITVWHVDPESDGSDDSCGWTFPKPNMNAEWCRDFVGDVKYTAEHFGLEKQRKIEGKVAFWILWIQRCSFRHRGKGLSQTELNRELFKMSYPGNRDEDYLEEDVDRLAWIFIRNYLSLIRPWYKHPKWHIWHWRIQVIPIQQFKRWAFSRCCKCGGRFSFGESPVSHSWYGSKPSWFKSEPNIEHMGCSSNQLKRNADAQPK